MSKEFVERVYKKRYDTKQKDYAESTDILDTRFKILLDTKEIIAKYKLNNTVSPVLSIPLAFDKNRGIFTLIETPTLQTSNIRGYYYTTTPFETTPDFYNLRIDAYHRLYVVDDLLLSRITPRLKASIFNQTVTANTNIFSTDISPQFNPSVFRIYATFNASGNLIVTRTKSGVTVNETLNGGTVLNANSAYIFDVIVELGETINLQYSANAAALVLKVIEIPHMSG